METIVHAYAMKNTVPTCSIFLLNIQFFVKVKKKRTASLHFTNSPLNSINIILHKTDWPQYIQQQSDKQTTRLSKQFKPCGDKTKSDDASLHMHTYDKQDGSNLNKEAHLQTVNTVYKRHYFTVFLFFF